MNELNKETGENILPHPEGCLPKAFEQYKEIRPGAFPDEKVTDSCTDNRQPEADASLPQKQAFCGFLNVLKPPGISSAQVVGRIRRLLGGEKVGHAGTLDPEASGVLPIMVGKAARLFDYLQDKEKAYIAEIAFGCATDTQDAQGKPIAYGENNPDRSLIDAALERFTGEQMQTPPMFSALKRDGRRLYDLARKGETVEVASRQVTVYSLTLLKQTPRHGALVAIHCSKVFYVRTLCCDLGAALGCPAHMRFLLRTRSGIFSLDTARTLEELSEASKEGTLRELLIPMETALKHLPALNVPEKLRKPFLNGVPLSRKVLTEQNLPNEQPVRLYLDHQLYSVGVTDGDLIRCKTWLGE